MTAPLTPEQLASGLLMRLRPLLPTVAAATKTQADTEAWVKSWSKVIAAESLTPDELARGVARIARAPSDRPFTPSVLLALCRPEEECWQAYQPAPARLPEPPDLRAAQRERGREVLAALTSSLRGKLDPDSAGARLIPSKEEARDLIREINADRKNVFS